MYDRQYIIVSKHRIVFTIILYYRILFRDSQLGHNLRLHSVYTMSQHELSREEDPLLSTTPAAIQSANFFLRPFMIAEASMNFFGGTMSTLLSLLSSPATNNYQCSFSPLKSSPPSATRILPIPSQKAQRPPHRPSSSYNGSAP